jgi:flagellar hook protein FlgE
MMRSFSLTLDGSLQNLWDLILATPNAVPTEGYLPNRVRVLDIAVTGSGTFSLADSNGQGLSGGSAFHRDDIRNSINLHDYNITGSGKGVVVGVNIEIL